MLFGPLFHTIEIIKSRWVIHRFTWYSVYNILIPLNNIVTENVAAKYWIEYINCAFALANILYNLYNLL